MNESLHTFAQSIASVTDADALIEALQTERQTSVRINPKKLGKQQLPSVPWCENGYYLENRPLFTLDPLFHSGAYYVQEASSMFIEQVIAPLATKPLRVLDLCAAPGGKTTLALSLLPAGSLLVANEVIKSRAQILSENLIKWGNPDCIVTNNDPKDFDFLRGFFDIIIVDAPCSGEGMFRKDSNAINEWSPENVDLCSKRQLRILYDIWPCLAPNGTLLYSTCTFNEKENEDVVSRFISENDATSEQIPLRKEWNITEREKNGAYSYRFFPHLTKGEGFSLSVIRKKEGCEYSLPKKIGQPKLFSILSNKNTSQFQSLVKNDDIFFYEDKINRVWALANEHQKILCEIASHCSLVHAGTPVAEVFGNKINPLPGLALSYNFAQNSFPIVEVDLETAIHYFKKEPLVIENAPKGWIQLVYNSVSLGFVKNIGNRANNPYPAEWAIKMNIDYSRLPKIDWKSL